MKKLFTSFFLLSTLVAFSQSEERFVDRLYFGGDIALSVSTNTTIIGASPLVGYKITDNWSAGVGVSYYYYSVRFSSFDYKTSFYGGNLFTRLVVLDNVLLQSEFHILNTDAPLCRATVRRRVRAPVHEGPILRFGRRTIPQRGPGTGRPAQSGNDEPLLLFGERSGQLR